MSAESGIQNPESGARVPGAAWMVRLGAVLALSVPALQLYVLERSALGQALLFLVDSEPLRQRWNGAWPSNAVALRQAAILLACLFPSLACSFRPTAYWGERLTLPAFLPLSGVSAVAAYAAAGNPFTGWTPTFWIHPLAAAAVPSLLALAVCVCWRIGALRSDLSRAGRFVLAVDLFWLALIDGNAWHFLFPYFPAWALGGGSLLVALGELLRRPAPMDP